MSNVSMIDGHIDEPKMTEKIAYIDEPKIEEEKVIKACGLCLKGDYDKMIHALCGKCPYRKHTNCKSRLRQDALDLINRLKAERDCYKNELHYANMEKEALNKLCGEQKAEIERLKEAYLVYEETTGLKQAKAEAIKEFAERLKKEFKPEINYGVVANCAIKLFRNTIDYLVKEMVGDEK